MQLGRHVIAVVLAVPSADSLLPTFLTLDRAGAD